MRILVTVLLQTLLLFPLLAQSTEEGNTSKYIESLLIPVLIAVIGYLLKMFYEVITEKSRRQRELLEEKLRDFYWPILTRLEQNDAIWRLILSKRSEMDDLKTTIAHYVEGKIILKNHREIMDIIMKSRYHARFDQELNKQLQDYFRHVAIYEGILESGEKTFPGLIGAPYPTHFDKLMKQRTEELQKQLDKKVG